MSDLNLLTAVDAAYRAGLEILKVYNSSTDLEIAYKADDSPLTIADKQAHRTIKAALEPLGMPILSEEGRSIAYEQRMGWKTFWIVDPLDGTKEFIKHNGEFTVNIALIRDGAPILGVVYVPVKDEMYFASRERGAFKIEQFSKSARSIEEGGDSDGMERLVSSAGKLPRPRDRQRGYMVVGSRSHGSADLDAYIQQLKTTHPDLAFIAAGSSLKLCLVAEGRADEYPRLGPTMEWDTAAGQAIAECAGAAVLEFENRQPLKYNKASLLNPWFLVIMKRG